MNYKEIKQWLESHVHRVIDSRTPDKLEIMTNVMKLHPNYDQWKLQIPTAFKISRSPKKKYLQVFVKFKDTKRWRSVSWVACATGKIRKVDSLGSAMRYSIKSQIRMWRQKNMHPIPKCALCNCQSNLEVDHHPIHFAKLKTMYLQTCKTVGLDVPKNQWDNRNTTYKFYPNSRFDFEWQNFHFQNATFRWLCADCNKKN